MAENQPACRTNPDAWDMDTGSLSDWLAALRVCLTDCLLLEQCAAARRAMYPGPANPIGVIWAGVAYTDTGAALRTGVALAAHAHRVSSPRPAVVAA